MRFTALFFGVFLCTSAVYGDPLSRGKMTDSDLRPLVSYFQKLNENSRTPKVIAFGEEHGRAELRDFYPKFLSALKAAKSNLNCIYSELEVSSQPSLDDYQAGRLPADQAIFNGIEAMFDKWNLKGVSGQFNWSNSVAATVQNVTISSELLQVAKKLGFKVIAVDEQSRADFLATVFQVTIENYDDEDKARAVMDKSGLLSEMPQYPFVYFREEIIFRRSRTMAEKIAQTISTGECAGGVFIAGSLHLQRKVRGGNRIYRNGGATAIDVLHNKGLTTHLFSFQIVDGGPRFSSVPITKKGAYYLLSPANYEHEWPASWEEQATVLLRKF